MMMAQCPECGYRYCESTANPREGFPPGTPWDAVPDDWNCPDCCVRDKVDFLILTDSMGNSPGIDVCRK
nr:rubredoxin [Mycolicibacterium tusciae]